jgi:hypothetical protein
MTAKPSRSKSAATEARSICFVFNVGAGEENGSATIRGFPPETTGLRFLKASSQSAQTASGSHKRPIAFAKQPALAVVERLEVRDTLTEIERSLGALRQPRDDSQRFPAKLAG